MDGTVGYEQPHPSPAVPDHGLNSLNRPRDILTATDVRPVEGNLDSRRRKSADRHAPHSARAEARSVETRPSHKSRRDFHDRGGQHKTRGLLLRARTQPRLEARPAHFLYRSAGLLDESNFVNLLERSQALANLVERRLAQGRHPFLPRVVTDFR